MQDIACILSPAALPAPRTPIAIRTATLNDLPFMDALQKRHSKALGYFPTKQFEGYIEGGGVLIAEPSVVSGPLSVVNATDNGRRTTDMPLGYVISRDRYLKRDELGVIYQLCVADGVQRKLVGASLVREVFQRSAYGCRLFCCWCAQDLAANYFWESLGFVPIAFRAGSGKKKRVHIFWQKRIDSTIPSPHHTVTPTPYWYPFKTDSGAIREDRIVLPIPPGVHWRDIRPADVRPVMLPRNDDAPKVLSVEEKRNPVLAQRAARSGQSAPAPAPTPPARVTITRSSALRFAPPSVPALPALRAPLAPAKAREKGRERKPAAKIDAKYLAAARELRDRYLERVNETALALASCGKYDVGRLLPPARDSVPPMPLASQPLPAAPDSGINRRWGRSIDRPLARH